MKLSMIIAVGSCVSFLVGCGDSSSVAFDVSGASARVAATTSSKTPGASPSNDPHGIGWLLVGAWLGL